jgi:4-amino-4-deoxy-L-arabinose transferase-like glycosyltransferase
MRQKIKGSSIKTAIEMSLVLAILLSVYCTGLGSVTFFGDESFWIHSSYYFETYFSGRFSSEVWEHAYYAVTQPPVARYVIGFTRSIGGYQPGDLNNDWDHNKDEQTNIQLGNKPSADLLWWSRLPMSILAVLSIAIAYILIKQTAGGMAGAIWIGMSITSAYFLLHLRRAMGEAPLLAGTMLVAWSGYKALQAGSKEDPDWRKTYIWLGIMGVCIGAAGASKLNGLSGLAAAGGLVIILAFKLNTNKSNRWLFIIGGTSVVVLMSMVVFVGLNPYLWSAPAGKFQALYLHRLDQMQMQVTAMPQDHIDSISQRFRIIPIRLLWTHTHTFSWTASSLEKVILSGINIVLFLTGFVYLVNQAWSWLSRGKAKEASIITLLMGVSTSIPVFFTPLDWDRYYLFPVFFITLCMTIGIGWYIVKTYPFAKKTLKNISAKLRNQ